MKDRIKRSKKKRTTLVVNVNVKVQIGSSLHLFTDPVKSGIEKLGWKLLSERKSGKSTYLDYHVGIRI